MVGDPDAVPADTLEDIAYLARSANRVRLLDALASGAYTRRELDELTGIARTTIGRIINEFEEYGWVERTTEGNYTATPVGEYVVAETDRYVGAIHAIRMLGNTVVWLPNEELTIGLQHFRNATVRRPKPNAMNAPTTFATELMREAAEFACLVNTPPSLAFEDAMMNGVFEGHLTTNHIITDQELAVLRQNPDRASRWQEYIEA